MRTALKQLIHDALELPTQERAELAHILIASIDDDVEEDISFDWDMELKKRVHEIREGRVKGIPAEDVFAKLREKYH